MGPFEIQVQIFLVVLFLLGLEGTGVCFVDALVGKHQYFESNSLVYWQPVQFLEALRDAVTFPTS